MSGSFLLNTMPLKTVLKMVHSLYIFEIAIYKVLQEKSNTTAYFAEHLKFQE